MGELTEREILQSILRRTGPSAALIGPGDDAAVVAAADGRIVASVDTLVHGPDFRLAWSSPVDLGWKAAAVNLADIAAMGARPTALLVALAVPDDTRLSFIEGLSDGLRLACAGLADDCAVEGGDLAVSDTLMIAVTALGVLDGRAPVLRSGARVGDVVAIAGELGEAARGLSVLFDRFRDAAGRPVAIDAATLATLSPEEARGVQRQLRPVPPLRVGPRAAQAGATAMMDVSDGLVLDATRLAEASGVTIDVASRSLGADPALALSGGEDHGLLATFPAGVSLPDGFRHIGMVVDRVATPVTIDGAAYEGRGGWDPYQDWDAARG